MTEGSTPGSILIIAGHPRSLVNFRGPLLRAMRDQGWSVEAAAPEFSQDERTRSRLTEMGITSHEIPLKRTGMNPLADVRLLVALVRLLWSRRPHVVLAYTMKAVIFGLIAAAITGVPRRFALITGVGYAFTGEAVGKRGFVQAAAKRLYRQALRRATKVFFQNPDDFALFSDLKLIPAAVPAVIVNGSGVDVAHFAVAPMPEGPVRFLLIARLLATKGIREYAAAAELMSRQHSDLEFHLVGGLDSNPDGLRASEVATWQRAGTLIWHGEVADVRPFIANSHVYVLPSYREGTPRSVLEAMAMGRPIITTDAPGCRETVSADHNGFLVPTGAVEPLRQAMERFVAQPELIARMGKHSRELAERKYDVRDVNRVMLKQMELA